MPIRFCSNPCVSPSAARWWETIHSTAHAEVQRHKLQAAPSTFTSLMVNGVRAGMKKDPHADFPYRIIKTETPQYVLAVAESEEDILQTWAALQQFLQHRTAQEIQALDWAGVGTRILEGDAGPVREQFAENSLEGWVDVSDGASQPQLEVPLRRLGKVLRPFQPVAKHVWHTWTWQDPYRSVACLIIVFNAWSRCLLPELWLLTLTVALVCIGYGSAPSAEDDLEVALNAITAATGWLAALHARCALVLPLAVLATGGAWGGVRLRYIALGPDALNTLLLGVNMVAFLGGLWGHPFWRRCWKPRMQRPPPSEEPAAPASPRSPTPSQATTEPGSPLEDVGGAMREAFRAELCPATLQALPPGPLAPAAELPESARRVLAIAHSDGWQCVSSSNGILYEAKAVPWSAVKAVRFTTTLQCSLVDLWEFLTNPDQLRKLDPLMVKLERLSTSEDTDVSLVYRCYNMFKAPVIGVSKRDFVIEIANAFMLSTDAGLVRATTREEITANEAAVLVQGSCSVDEDQRPPVKNAVRGINFGFGYIARPAASGIHLVQVMSLDPKGWLPPATIDAGNRVQIDKLRKMQKLLCKP